MRSVFPTALILAIGAADLQAQIPVPGYDHSRTHAARGYYFQCPTDVFVTHLQVPDEMLKGSYEVALYKMKTEPPVYSNNTRLESPVFYRGGVTSNTRAALLPPVHFKKGEWLGVLGGCGAKTLALKHVSCSKVSQPPSRVSGIPVVLKAFISQDVQFSKLNGAVPCGGQPTGWVHRIRVFTAAQAYTTTYGVASCNTWACDTPSLRVSDPYPPSIGFKAAVTARSGTMTSKGGVWMIGLQRAAMKLPGIGTINISPIVASIPVPALSQWVGTTLSLNIPKNNLFIGVKIPMQVAVLEGGGLGLSNGAEWYIDK